MTPSWQELSTMTTLSSCVDDSFTSTFLPPQISVHKRTYRSLWPYRCLIALPLQVKLLVVSGILQTFPEHLTNSKSVGLQALRSRPLNSEVWISSAMSSRISSEAPTSSSSIPLTITRLSDRVNTLGASVPMYLNTVIFLWIVALACFPEYFKAAAFRFPPLATACG